MCEANALMIKEGTETMLMESVDVVEVEGDTVKMVNIFGEQKILKARIKNYSNSERKILLEAIE